MNHVKKMAKNIAKSLVFAIGKYQAHNRGRYPEKIFAELGAVYALQVECPLIFDTDHEVRFNGIPVVPIGRDGLGIWLAGEQVTIRDFSDTGSILAFRREAQDEQA